MYPKLECRQDMDNPKLSVSENPTDISETLNLAILQVLQSCYIT